MKRSLFLCSVFFTLLSGCELFSSSDEGDCVVNAQCDKGRVCLNGYCVYECYVDSDCAALTERPYCSFHRCVAVSTNASDNDAEVVEDSGIIKDSSISIDAQIELDAAIDSGEETADAAVE